MAHTTTCVRNTSAEARLKTRSGPAPRIRNGNRGRLHQTLRAYSRAAGECGTFSAGFFPVSEHERPTQKDIRREQTVPAEEVRHRTDFGERGGFPAGRYRNKAHTAALSEAKPLRKNTDQGRKAQAVLTPDTDCRTVPEGDGCPVGLTDL